MGILGTLLAGNTSRRIVEDFRDDYRSMYGTYPSSSTLESLGSAITVIGAFAGTGRESLGAERLANSFDSYIRSVGYDEDKSALGFSLLFSMCSTYDGKPAKGYEWAYNALEQKIQEYFPY